VLETRRIEVGTVAHARALRDLEVADDWLIAAADDADVQHGCPLVASRCLSVRLITLIMTGGAAMIHRSMSVPRWSM
jgi:hypothetical protein